MINIFGGNIKLLNRSLTEPTADYEWNGKYWDMKTPKGLTS